MNTGPCLLLGAIFTFGAAWLGLVFFPNEQLKNLEPAVAAGQTVAQPQRLSGIAERGKVVYQKEGCVYCHSQQIRGGHWNADLLRGWGPRRSVPRDYIFDRPQLLGTMRTGPDLTNVGARLSNADWHLRHLYSPPSVSPGSIMPPFKFLFEKRKITGEPSAIALKLEGDEKPEVGFEIVPTEDALALAAYLLALDHTYDTPDDAGAVK